jgi:signal transduction histidine kinase
MLTFYLGIYRYIACKRLEKKDLPERYMHSHLVSVLSTGLLMWAYAFVALYTMSSLVPVIVGMLTSLTHLLSPLLYRKSNNYFLFSNVFILSGLIHQSTFAFYTGGFDSNILIWLGILPMLSGVTAGRRGAILWAFITSATVLVFFMLKLSGFHFPFAISEAGQMASQALILFGWIFLSTVIIWVYVLLVEQNSAKLEDSRQRTQNLINVLSHDISTPLTVISVKLGHLIKTPLSDLQLNSAARAYKATERVIQITESIKELRLTELGKKEITYGEIDLREMILELKEIFADRLDQKNIRFNWSVSNEVYSFVSSRSLLLNQILGNLLSNAIKFSTPGTEIRLRISKVSGGIQFLIEDSGGGIPKDMRENIFEANLSRSCVGTNGEVGTGFGLPIVKGCVDRLNGKISFETKTTHEGPPGTRFKLFFPF